MNRKISSAILGIAFLGATAFALHTNNFGKTVSDLELANIEALSETDTSVTECPPGGYTECHRILAGNVIYIFNRK
ncbi:hypothetical protein [Lepagella muris]|jgi:hypothetical protein|uniref:Uncharacterized protein n=1 Tax=Lepagella muris TaxID=3032870 RepID=A0AC61RJ55_9BACT|nr:hypothetical protein [Lepagella muris]ROT02854.1 hypothetical protein EEL33_19185 [Muribaculaceae bacterium Isolate-037 (Harlan)]TGY80199.1 hypothetical protein E5331_02870 [Lepagella muris]THG52738.1 hypothetical protein E5984_05350 [Bacteroidales bacterium]TKC58866.1 hypothetical protein E5359_009410 [Bacteroidales bacterium]